MMEHLALLGALAGNIALVIALKNKTPQPFDVRMISAMATEKDCKERHEAAQREIAEMRNRRENDMTMGSLSRKAIYENIRDTNTKTLTQIESVRSELSSQMNEMPDRIVAQLLNSKRLFHDSKQL